MPAPSIGALPVPPKSNDSQAVFKSKRKPWLDGFEVFIDELNSLILWINTEYAESGMQIDILPDATKYADPKNEFNTESNATAIALDNFIVQMNLLIEATGAPELSPINPLPPHPNKVTDSKSVFNKRAFAWMAALAGTSIADSSGSGLSGIAGQINGFVEWVNDGGGGSIFEFTYVGAGADSNGGAPPTFGGDASYCNIESISNWPGYGEIISPTEPPFLGGYDDVRFGYLKDVDENLFFVLSIDGADGSERFGLTVSGVSGDLVYDTNDAAYEAVYGGAFGWVWAAGTGGISSIFPTDGTVTIEILDNTSYIGTAVLIDINEVLTPSGEVATTKLVQFHGQIHLDYGLQPIIVSEVSGSIGVAKAAFVTSCTGKSNGILFVPVYSDVVDSDTYLADRSYPLVGYLPSGAEHLIDFKILQADKLAYVATDSAGLVIYAGIATFSEIGAGEYSVSFNNFTIDVSSTYYGLQSFGQSVVLYNCAVNDSQTECVIPCFAYETPTETYQLEVKISESGISYNPIRLGDGVGGIHNNNLSEFPGFTDDYFSIVNGSSSVVSSNLGLFEWYNPQATYKGAFSGFYSGNISCTDDRGAISLDLEPAYSEASIATYADFPTTDVINLQTLDFSVLYADAGINIAEYTASGQFGYCSLSYWDVSFPRFTCIYMTPVLEAI